MSENTRSRRSFLAGAAGAGVALAGCSSRNASSEDTPAPSSDGGSGGTEPAVGASSGEARESATTPHPEPYVDLYRELIDSVVVIRGYDESGRVGQGSGFVAFDGTVVTNQHVVEGTDQLFVGFTGGERRTV